MDANFHNALTLFFAHIAASRDAVSIKKIMVKCLNKLFVIPLKDVN